MKTVLLACVLLFVYSALADSPTKVLQGVPGDTSFCSISDGEYLYQFTGTDPAKIVKVKLDNLERVKEYIIPFAENVQFACPATFDKDYQNIYMVGVRNGIAPTADSSSVIVSIDKQLSSHSVHEFESPAGTYYFAMFTDANYIYLPYNIASGYRLFRLKISDWSNGGIANIADTSSSFAGLIPDPDSSSDKIAVFINSQVIRFSLRTFSVIDSRPVPATIQSIGSTVSGAYIFFNNVSAVVRYDLATLSQEQSTPSFEPNVVRFVKVDPFNEGVIHIDHRFKGNGYRDPTPYPYQYIRASVEPFQITDSSAYEISATQINQPNFLDVFNNYQVFQHTSNLDATDSIITYGVPVIHRVNLDASPKEIYAFQNIGSEFASRVDLVGDSLLILANNGIIKKSIVDASSTQKRLPNGVSFQYSYAGAGIISSDKQFAYYPLNYGVGKFSIADLSLVDSKTVFAGDQGYWTGSAASSGDNLYFYRIANSPAGSSVVRYEYNSGASSTPTPLQYNGLYHNLIYDSAVDSTGNLLYCGTQSGDGGLYVIRFNFNTNSIDKVVKLEDTYYIPAVELDRNQEYLVVTTNAKAFKIRASDLTITASIDFSFFGRLSAVAWDKTNSVLYLGGNNGLEKPFNVQQIDYASFTLVKSYEDKRASSSRVAYDSCTDTFYFVGYETFVTGTSYQPSNIGVIGNGGSCSSSSSASPSSSSAPTSSTQPSSSGSPTSSAPSSSVSPSTPAPPTPSSTENISGDNNARAVSDATKVVSVVGVIFASVIALLL